MQMGDILTVCRKYLERMKFKTGDKVYRKKDSKKKVYTVVLARGWSSKKQCHYYVLEDQNGKLDPLFWYEYQLDFIQQ